jgi:pimeloyl-ACP methyl ester carboxylesterase
MKTLRYILLLSLWAGVAEAAPADAPAPAATTEAATTAPQPLSPDAEQEVVARLRASPAAGDIQELSVDGKPVLALWRNESLGRPQGGVVLLHDSGAHADWPGVIGPLRRDLPLHGWSTLSLQLPAHDATDAATQIQARLRAALAFLAGRNIRNIILLGHGAGARAALRYAADTPGSGNGLVLIAMGKAEDNTLLERIKVPIYDIYGSGDGLEVRDAGEQRLLAGRRLAQQDGGKPPRYRQFVVESADHFFSEQTEILQRRVRGWLKTHAEGTEITQ